MSLKHQIQQRRYRRRGPIGTACGLLVACLVTAIGVLNGIEPHIILIRALVSSLAMASVVGLGLGVISLANASRT